MAIIILSDRCDGCSKHGEKRCASICPSNILAPDKHRELVVTAEEGCWECMACVKTCPREALALTYDGRTLLIARPLKQATWWKLERRPAGKHYFIRPATAAPKPSPDCGH